MAAAEPVLARIEGSETPTWRGQAFGLALEASFPLPWLIGGEAALPERAVALELVSLKEANQAWPTADGTAVRRQQWADGTPMLWIDWHPTLGYRFWWPGHGRHRVSQDGRRVWTYHSTDISPWRWHKFLVTQLLPLAARLQGLEVLHASAVAFDGEVTAFVAQSGAGKSSVAAHLVARGADSVTDDVLAVDTAGEGLVAHPGVGLICVAQREVNTMSDLGKARLGNVIGRSDKVNFQTRPYPEPLPLSRIYYLSRSKRYDRLRFEVVEPPDPKLVLASTFTPYVREAAHLLRQLDASARIANRAELVRVQIPATTSAAAAAAAIERQVSRASA